MRIYSMSDIHGHLDEFKKALSLVTDKLSDKDTMLILLGDYVHMGPDSRGVLDLIISLETEYGKEKVIALMGNHEDSCIMGLATIDDTEKSLEGDAHYIAWMKKLPLYRVFGNTIYCHAGIDEEAGDWWESGTPDHIFTSKYPADLGQIPDIDKKVVAGHIGTAAISGDASFHDIFYDGASHYYIDGSVYDSGVIPVLLTDTDTERYYKVTPEGNEPVRAYKGSLS